MTNEQKIETIPHAVFLVSLGCAKNLVDTEVIAGALLTHGYELAFDPEDADLYLINSCAFIPAAREEAYAAIEEGSRWKKARPGRKLVLSGCLTQWDQDGSVKKRYPEVDLWTTVNQIPEIVALVNGEKNAITDAAPDVPTYLYSHEDARLQLTAPHVAYLKIADGCDNRCSYCAIPNLRGKLRSRPISSVVAEAKQLISNGVKELLVIAQDITAFGHDRPADGETLPQLLEQLNALDGNFVIRLLYTHPAHYSEELIDFMSRTDTKVLPYLDIPLQHISERILQAMHRHVSQGRIKSLLAELRRRIPNLTIRSTFITGLPGETKQEFQELMDFVKEQRFERCGVFPFSPEPGTPAAKMPDQVSERTAKSRARRLIKLQTELMLERNRELVGKIIPVIIDDVDGKTATARGSMDAPDIDNHIRITNAHKLHAGDLCQVKVTGADYYELTGKVITAGKEQQK